MEEEGKNGERADKEEMKQGKGARGGRRLFLFLFLVLSVFPAPFRVPVPVPVRVPVPFFVSVVRIEVGRHL